jgi:hypothetical protein
MLLFLSKQMRYKIKIFFQNLTRVKRQIASQRMVSLSFKWQPCDKPDAF